MQPLQRLAQLPSTIEATLLQRPNVIRLLVGRLLLMVAMVLSFCLAYRPTA
jgi:hypothetical protein